MRIERVLASNPSPYTGPGTNTWIVESADAVAIIDPGPVDDSHARAIAERVGERRVEAVLVTHTHEDHAPGAKQLRKLTGAEVLGHEGAEGVSLDGTLADGDVVEATEFHLPAYGYEPGPAFDPDVRLVDGSEIEVEGLRIRVVHTPGHSDDHLCFLADRILFTGDHIMGGSSVMVEKMAPYLESLERLRGLDVEALHPGHGETMTNPSEVIDWYVAHRLQREQEVLQAVRAGAASVADIVEVVYRDVDHSLHPLAAVSVRAHLEKLAADGMVVVEGQTVRTPSEGSR